MPTRKYEQRLRAEAAEATRRRILDAVYAALRAAPAASLGIDRVARLARVARPTVYQVFGSRAGLFEAAGADLMSRGGFAEALGAAAGADARAALRATIRAVAGAYAPHHGVLRALHAMARLDPAAGAWSRDLEEDRAAGMARLAARLAAQGALRAEVAEAEAADLLCLFTAFESFDRLYAGRGLPAGRVADTLTAAAERALCG
ncbi:TetR family transcriptional regulator [Streptomyces hoynatensis]|uniref:TetR family transcriptional regulator n=1 Tax=Streptomyces hoynatensis TaxID=1141874 RepID=A0A3A9ZC06_9ACTN|nr:TetR family transcriptional regulator [Streptomyces hoynatensis]RKN45773.1 TetR family transcriptional regulator [Streptomyces hoynatensis]